MLTGGVLLLAVAGVALTAHALGAPPPDVQQLALILLVSGAGSLLLGAALMRWGGRRWASLRLRLALAWIAGVAIAAVNVLFASALMFINAHDRSLLLLLLGYAAALSLVFGYGVTSGLIAELGRLGRAARRLSEGDLGARVGPAGGDEIGRLAATFDQMAARLQASFERERALEAGRRELIAAVSHDLRTPLTTIRAMIEAVTDGVVSGPAEVDRYLGLIRGEVQHLSRLIDDLFELSQIDSGALQLRLTPTRLPDLLARTLEPYQASARDRGVRLEHLAPVGLPPVAADPARLQRVLRNLVDNALQHTPAGGTVRVEAGAAGGAAQVAVQDTGPGLPPEDLERVFDRFYRGARARSRAGGDGGGATRPTGAGLGLAIARGLVQAHGGRIWAEPAAGGGATFRFTLPLSPPDGG
jgi:two-component system, OmpR family, sensor histidine kinase SaeS